MLHEQLRCSTHTRRISGSVLGLKLHIFQRIEIQCIETDIYDKDSALRFSLRNSKLPFLFDRPGIKSTKGLGENYDFIYGNAIVFIVNLETMSAYHPGL